jgi:4-aminobutyrate aminotransferase/(S)-3-amino-2-methylpropionate transaminase
MAAMELVADRKKKTPAADEAKALVKYCFERGLMVLSCGMHGNVIRLMMPLTTAADQLSKGLDIIEEGLEGISKG